MEYARKSRRSTRGSTRASTTSRGRRRSTYSGIGPPKGRHILALSKKERMEFLNSFDVVLTEIVGEFYNFDGNVSLAGVLWWVVEDIPNAGTVIMSLKALGKNVKFVTNYSRYTDEQFLQRMATIGITNVKKSDIVQPCKTLTQYLKRFMLGQRVFSLCGAEMNKEFHRQGINVFSTNHDANVKLDEIISELQDHGKVGAVVLDWNLNLTYADLARAHHYLQRESCVFLVGSTDTYVQVGRKFKTLGPGFFMSLLRESTGREPLVWGKPGTALCEELMQYYKFDDPSRVLFIGCDQQNDIEFASSCGYQTCFVATGTSNVKTMMQMPDKYKPDYIARSIGDFVELLTTKSGILTND